MQHFKEAPEKDLSNHRYLHFETGLQKVCVLTFTTLNQWSLGQSISSC